MNTSNLMWSLYLSWVSLQASFLCYQYSCTTFLGYWPAAWPQPVKLGGVGSSHANTYFAAALNRMMLITSIMASFHRQLWVCRFLLSLFCACLLKRRQVTAWSPLCRVYRALQARRRHNVVTFSSDTNTTIIHNYFMEIALQQAKKANRIGEVPIGAIVVRPMPNSPSTRRFQVLSRASNQVETTHDASAHAELLAMRQASSRIRNWRLLNTTLYSTLEPCPMCLAACQSFRVHQIVYGAPDLRLGAIETHMQLLEVPHPFHNISTIIKYVHGNESKEMLQVFFKRRRQESKQQKRRIKGEKLHDSHENSARAIRCTNRYDWYSLQSVM
jgi:tRNA(adenine34) deaminase